MDIKGGILRDHKEQFTNGLQLALKIWGKKVKQKIEALLLLLTWERNNFE